MLTYVFIAFPKVSPAKDIKISATPEQLARGEYLANHVVVCVDCHGARDWTKFSGPIIEGTEGMGGEIFDHRYNFPGSFSAKNITPSGIGDWSDGEVYRMITEGVTKDGDAVFPVMPYPGYKHMTEEDVKSVIAYIRTLKPIENKVPESKPDFPMNIIMRTMPQPATPMSKADLSTQEGYGKYLLNIAGCWDCHTKKVKGEPVEGMFLAGGFEFQLPYGIVRSSNITPHEETGIGYWTEDAFVNRFKSYSTEETRNIKVLAGQYQTVMPWTMYAKMTEDDLRAIYKYLRTIPAVENTVDRFTVKKN